MNPESARSEPEATSAAAVSARRAVPALPAATVSPSPGHRRLAFAALMLGFFTILAAATSVNTALPVIERDLHASLTQVEWLVDSYFLTLTVLMTTFGRFGDIFGRKHMFVTGGVLFVLGSLASALAHDINALIAFRVVTALGPAMMMPATLSLITDLFPPAERGVPLGIWGSMAGVAIGVGPVMGGILVSDVSWQWVFWINVLLGATSVALAALLLPPPPPRPAQRPAHDLPGVVLSGASIFCLSYALVEGGSRGWSSRLIIGFFVASALLMALFVWRELRATEPMLRLDLFRRRAFSAGTFVTMTISFGLLGVFVMMPLYLQTVRGDSALQSGLTLLPVAVAMAVVGPFGGFLSGRVPNRWPIAFALTLFTLGIFWLAHLTTSTSRQWLIGPFLVVGIGLGISSANVNTAVMSVVPRAVAGAAAGVVVTVRQLGSVLGIAVLGAVLQHREAQVVAAQLPHAVTAAQRTQVFNQAFTDGLNAAFLVCSAILAVGAAAALLIRNHEAPPHTRGR